MDTLCWRSWSILLLFLIEVIAVPHLPQQVYPSKDRTRPPLTKSDGISRGKTTTKNTGNTLMSRKAHRPPQQQGITQSPQIAAQLQQDLPQSQQAPAQSHQSGYSTTTKSSPVQLDAGSTKGQNETRVVLAPIDGEKVYTLDHFKGPKIERTLVEPQKSSRSNKTSRPKTALAGAKTQLSRGISLVNEVLVAPDQKRTTMLEATPTTTGSFQTSTPPAPQYSTNQSSSAQQNVTSKTSQKLAQLKSPLPKDPALGLRNVRLVSHDTSSGHASSELRYPAQKWQLPPSLYLARQNQHARDLDTNSVKNGDYAGNSAAEEEQIDASYEQALEIYMKSQNLPVPPKNLKVPTKQNVNGTNYFQKQKLNDQLSTAGPLMQTLEHVGKSIDDVIKKTFGEKKARPKVTYINGDHKKFRATFATHQDNKNAIPLPSAPFPDETDMDLLVENTRRTGAPQTPILHQSVSHQGVVAHSGVPSPILHPNLPSQGVPASISHQGVPASIAHRPVPIQQTPAQATYRSVDPNYKLDLCCRKQQVGPVCQQMCNFDTFTDRSLISAVLSNQCPGPQLGQAFDCASSKADHTECCTRNNLHLYAGGQCMPFCRTHQPTPPNLISYIACLQVFDTIKNCYREHSYTHPNIYGD